MNILRFLLGSKYMGIECGCGAILEVNERHYYNSDLIKIEYYCKTENKYFTLRGRKRLK